MVVAISSIAASLSFNGLIFVVVAPPPPVVTVLTSEFRELFVVFPPRGTAMMLVTLACPGILVDFSWLVVVVVVIGGGEVEGGDGGVVARRLPDGRGG